jgi:ribonuclease VapC
LNGIVIDTSVIIAILRIEPEKDRFMNVILAAHPRMMSAVSFQEASAVLAGRTGGEAEWKLLDALLADLDIEIMAHTAPLALISRDAFLRFGKGRHPAALNLGDCASYALAKANNLPLLFKGGDFGQTDVLIAGE